MASSANGKLGLGLIGVGGRGNSHLVGFGSRDDCRLVSLCDVNQQTLAAAQDWVHTNRGYKPTLHEDMRQMLDDPQIDAVVIATARGRHPMPTWNSDTLPPRCAILRISASV